MPIAAAAFVAVAVWAVVAYNRLVRDANLVREAWSGIDVQFRMRYDLVPALVETVKGYRLHERALFEEVAAARARCAGTASSWLVASASATASGVSRSMRAATMRPHSWGWARHQATERA